MTLRADWVASPLEPGDRSACLWRACGDRGLYLKVQGGAMDLGWANLAVPSLAAVAEEWVAGSTSSGLLLDAVQAALDELEERRRIYTRVELCCLEAVEGGWRLLRLGGPRVYVGQGGGFVVVGAEHVLPGSPDILLATLGPRLRWTVDPDGAAAAAQADGWYARDESREADELRAQARSDDVVGPGPLVLVSHPFWTELSDAQLAAALSGPTPAASLFEHGSGTRRAVAYLTK